MESRANLLTTVDFTFNADRHEYAVAGKIVPGCTAVLASGGLIPFARAEADILERKSELGREVHRACHLHNLGTLGSYDKEVKPRLHAWIYFKEHCDFRLLASEAQSIGYVNGMPFGFQLDCNALVDGRDTMIEWKIGQVYPHHGVQLAGQAAGHPHASINSPFARFVSRRRIVVELRENGFPKIHPFNERSDYETFAALLYVSAWKKRFKTTYEKENVL